MTQPDRRSNERICDGRPYPGRCLFESSLPEGGIHGDDQRKKVEAEISELKAREERIREMRQLREAMVRNFLVRHSSDSIGQ